MPAEPLTSFAERNVRETPGWYGKLATLGDFAHRRLPQEFIQIGDAWMSRAMSSSHQQLGDRWLDVYLTAPVMRFAWAPGIADANWWFGVLMPSCDNVGRYFPLMIAQRRARPPLDRIAVDHLEAWFDHLATTATHTLADRASVEALEEALEDAPPWPTPGTQTSFAPRPVANGSRYSLDSRASLDEWLHAMAVDDLHARFAGCSIWWRQGATGQESTATVVRGLPEPTSFAEMLGGG